MSTAVTVDVRGFFFTGNPVGALRMTIYREIFPDAAAIAASAWASQMTEGHGLMSRTHVVSGRGQKWELPGGDLQRSIGQGRGRPARASRGVVWSGHGVVVAGTKGYEPVRFYGRKIDRKYKFTYRAGAALQAWVDANVGSIASRLARAIDR